MHPNNNHKIYFASDFHLGVPDLAKSMEREKLLVKWLEMASKDAKEIYLMGDLFDFWFEYKHSIPKGFTRFLGKLAQICDSGIPVHVFIGNHDMWMFGYLESEIGVNIIRKPIDIELNGKLFHLAHGDGLGPGDRGYKMIKKIFASKTCQWLFARIHPNTGISIANFWSKRSRLKEKQVPEFMGEEKEWLIHYCKEKLEEKNYDFFIFGHRHLPIEHVFENGARYINLGDWIQHNTYAVFSNELVELKKFEIIN